MNFDKLNDAMIEVVEEVFADEVFVDEEEGIEDLLNINIDNIEDDCSIRQALEDYGLSVSNRDLF